MAVRITSIRRSEEHTSELQSYTTLFRSILDCGVESYLSDRWHSNRERHDLGFERHPGAWQFGLHQFVDRKSTRLNSSPTRRSSDLYWTAASNHIYPIVGTQTAKDTIWALNGILAHGSSDYINSYLVPLMGANTPIFITELNCCSSYSNKFLSYLYNGIFLAEYTARLSAVPNVKAVGVNSLYTENSDYHGLIQSVDDFESYLLNQVAADPGYSTNTAINPNTQFQFYTSAPGLAMQVANLAINSGKRIWPTIVVGGPTVDITGFDGNPIPSVYAQAYLADNGRHHLLITNKCAEAQLVAIELDGAKVQGTLIVTYVTNSSPLAANTAQSPSTVRIQTMTSSNPIRLAKYSVTTVTW